jgi:RNA-directed DNA polymerase
MYYNESLSVFDVIKPITLELLNTYAEHKNIHDNIERYQTFTIKKKSGGDRIINAPNGSLKFILRCLNIVLQSIFNPHKSATGFVANKSIVDNARVHTGNNFVYNIDLENFFTSIGQSRVEECLKNPPFNLNDGKAVIAEMIAGLCCEEVKSNVQDELANSVPNLKSVLPQGAPTSPTLSNIVAYNLDVQLSNLAKRFKLRYTRYADDITFSSMDNVYQNDSKFIKELNRIIEVEQFTINQSKVRLQEKSVHRQEVTGLIVNEKVNVKRRYVKQIRSWLYLWDTYGYEKASIYFQRSYLEDKGHIKVGLLYFHNVVLGKLNYLKMVVGSDDKRYKRLRELYDKLYAPFKKRKKELEEYWKKNSSISSSESEILHTPKDTWQFLKLFEDKNSFKFLVHDFEDAEEDFSRDIVVKTARKAYNLAKMQLRVPKHLDSRFYHFAFLEKPNWFTRETGEKKTHDKGWSGKELTEWCNKPMYRGIHPFKDAYYLDEMIMPFKHSIEVRHGKLQPLFNQVINNPEFNMKGKFDVKFINLNKAKFLTDVYDFELGLICLFSPFREIADVNKKYSIEITFKWEIVDNYRLKIITITHLDSLPFKHSDAPDLLKGDLNSAKELFRNLCNWSIEAKFEDGFKRVNILNDNPSVPPIETIEKSEVGFTHVLSFY